MYFPKLAERIPCFGDFGVVIAKKPLHMSCLPSAISHQPTSAMRCSKRCQPRPIRPNHGRVHTTHCLVSEPHPTMPIPSKRLTPAPAQTVVDPIPSERKLTRGQSPSIAQAISRFLLLRLQHTHRQAHRPHVRVASCDTALGQRAA
jgi:hypothetical protein